MSTILENEPLVRLSAFFGILFTMGFLETLIPCRKTQFSRLKHWIVNLSLVALGSIVVRFLLPMTPFQLAQNGEISHFGILNQLDISQMTKVLIAIVVLDLVVYFQHVMFHAVPLLWKLHMVHHADIDYDVTTGGRFHPVEIFISAWIKIGAVYLLGAPAVSVVLFEVILNGTAMFNHSNVRLPLGLDRVLRLFLVTPDMHRVHHSIIPSETNSNFGFNFPFWDRFWGTYKAHPDLGQTGMTIGLSQFRDSRVVNFLWMLKAPFIADAGSYDLRKRS